jgi:FixJ family two-component response regulator
MRTERYLHNERGRTPPVRKQVYVVDDDESVGRALKSLMLAYGFAVRIFQSAEDFFSAIPNGAPGCLILDICMPQMEGWEAQEHLLKSGSKRPVIMITGNKNTGFNERALKAGAAGFLQKPFHDRDLIILINQAMPNKQEE